MIYGGYPQTALENSKKERKLVLQDIFDLFAKKDLVLYLQGEDFITIKKLLEYLAINNGQKIQYDDVGRTIGISTYLTKQYVELLQEFYIIKLVRPFYKNKNKELTKIPKVYFIDNGVRNYFLKNFINIELRQNAGFLFEGYIFGKLLKSQNLDLITQEIKYRNDKQQHEVDFIIEKNGEILPYEVKYKKHIKTKDLKGLTAFYKNYNTKLYLINLDKQITNKGINYILPFCMDNI